VVFPDSLSGSSEDWALQILADHREDLSVLEVQAAVADLDPDLQVELIALMWLGRGDYAIEEWETALADAQDQYEEHDNTAHYLLSHPMVADHLQEGLIAHGHSCDE